MIKKLLNNKTMQIMDIFTKNLNLKIHGREIARKLKANQRTIKLALDNLEKENILKSELKGKNKEFSLNKNNILTKQIMIMAEEYKTVSLLNKDFEIYSIIKDIKGVTKNIILIYGSFAKGYARKESDLDILIINGKNNKEIEKIKTKYSKNTHILFLTEKQFIEGLRKGHNLIRDLTNNHIICQGTEKFTNWRFEYGQD